MEALGGIRRRCRRRLSTPPQRLLTPPSDASERLSREAFGGVKRRCREASPHVGEAFWGRFEASPPLEEAFGDDASPPRGVRPHASRTPPIAFQTPPDACPRLPKGSSMVRRGVSSGQWRVSWSCSMSPRSWWFGLWEPLPVHSAGRLGSFASCCRQVLSRLDTRTVFYLSPGQMRSGAKYCLIYDHVGVGFGFRLDLTYL